MNLTKTFSISKGQTITEEQAREDNKRTGNIIACSFIKWNRWVTIHIS
jgi:hypothetical protein